MHIETIAVHAGEHPDPVTGAIVPPLSLSTTFQRGADGSYPSAYHYGRSGNPNRDAFETCVAQLEAGACGIAFASGTAATSAVFATLEPGDHAVVAADTYYGTALLLHEHCMRWGLEVTFVDFGDVAALAAAMRENTRVVWGETPSNPMLRIIDIERVAGIAHEAGAICAIDNTFATPVLQRPILHGADIVMHSATKYLGGHSDASMGVVVVHEDDDTARALRAVQVSVGGVPSPFDCWLVMRGIKTLPCRMRTHARSAMVIARRLAEHPRVTAVHYPGLESHPGHDVAARQMTGFGGMLSFRIDGSAQDALAVVARARLFTRATSLGGVHSLIEHRASMEAPGTRTPQDLVRLSVGLEHEDDLIEDLEQALAG